jgi:hypothetical protein
MTYLSIVDQEMVGADACNHEGWCSRPPSRESFSWPGRHLKKITTAINMFFLCWYFPRSVSSILEDTVNIIFIHYDNTNGEIRDAISRSLRFEAVVAPEQVLKNAEAASVK